LESQKDPANDPLLLWFNGGPGCSSMLGFAMEHGPYVNNDNKTDFVENEWSWNKEANIIYLEMPAMVGYSYTDDPENENYFDDHITSADNLVAMVNLFEKFPEYAKHDLYVVGESYAGVYVPYMAWRMD